MPLLSWVLVTVVAVVWVLSLVDVFRRGYSGWTMAGWIALIIVLPLLGSVIYWSLRKPTPAEVEAQTLAEADLRRSAAGRPFDSTGTGI